MGYTVGDLLRFKQDALTQNLKRVSVIQKRLGVEQLFNPKPVDNEGTDIIKWRIWYDDQRLSGWGVRNGPSKKVAGKGARQLMQVLGKINVSVDIDEDVLLWVQAPDDNPKTRAMQWITNAQEALMSQAHNQIEHAIWSILTTGEITIDQSDDPRNPQIMTIAFGVPAAHIGQVTTLDWSDPESLILSDPTSPDETWGGIFEIPEDEGYEIKDVFMNGNTGRYLFGNEEVQKLWSDKRKDILIENNFLTHLDARDVYKYNRKYEDSSGDLQRFIADDLVVGVPGSDVRQKLFTLQQGECMVPDDSTRKPVKKMGLQSYVTWSEDPVAASIHVKWNVIPAIMDPDCFITYNVVPAA